MDDDELLATMPGFVEREYNAEEFAGRQWFCLYGNVQHVENGVLKTREYCGKNTKVHQDLATVRRAARWALNNTRNTASAKAFICEVIVPVGVQLPMRSVDQKVKRWGKAGAVYPIAVVEELMQTRERVIRLAERAMLPLPERRW